MSLVDKVGYYLKQLKLQAPFTGRFIAEDGVRVNIAEFIRSQPISIARGLKPGAQPFGAYGERVVTGAELDLPIWPDGPILVLPQTGAQMTIASTSVADDFDGGANARKIEMHYLDANLDQQKEEIDMQGQTDVLTEATDIRWVQALHLMEFGTIAKAAGIITAKFGGDTFAQISAGKLRNTSSFRMVPRGKLFYLGGAVGSSVSLTADTTTLMHMVASELDVHRHHDPLILLPFAGIGLQNGAIAFQFPPGIRYSAGTLVGGVHDSNKSCTVTMNWFGHLENAPDE